MTISATTTPASWEDVEAMPVDEPEATDEPAGDEPTPESTEASQPAATAEAESQSDSESPSSEPAKPKEDLATPDKSKEHRPFAFTVDRTRREVPGAIETHDGYIVIPRQSWEKNVQPNLRDPEVWRRERNEMQRQLAERDPEKSPVFQRARMLTEEIDRLVKAGPEAAVQWALDLLSNYPVLEARAEAAAAKRELTEHKSTLTSQQYNEQVQHLQAELPRVLKNEVAALLKAEEFAGLGLNADELFEDLWEIRNSIFFEAPEDIPEADLSKGEIGFRRDVIHRLVKRQADTARRARQGAEQAAAARKANDSVLKPATVPAAVPSKGSPAPAGRKAEKPRTYEEWEASLKAKD